MACVQCKEHFLEDDEYDYDDGQSIQQICHACLDQNKRKFVDLETQIRELKASVKFLRHELDNTQIKELKATLKFLRHELGNEPTLGDRDGVVMIIVHGLSDQPLPAHKFILASRSCVFRKMFEAKMQEEETGILRITDATLPVVRAVIKFCYDAQIEFTDEVTSEAVLEVAHKYEIDLLRKICEEDLTKTISEGNLPKRLKLARKFLSTGLEVAASQFFKDNFDEVIADVLSELC